MSKLFAVALVALTLGMAASAVAREPASQIRVASAMAPIAITGMPVFVQDISPEAVEAVKVVDAFSAAIKAVKIAEAAKLLDANVLVLESGSSERSRDQYLHEHAIADAAFMQTASQELRYRQARAIGDVAWVGTESVISRAAKGRTKNNLSTESMVLRRTASGWKIVHVHWSSRPQ